MPRLRKASLALFGRALPDEQVRAALRSAVGLEMLSLMATVYSAAGEFTAAVAEAELELLVHTSPAASGPLGPLSLAVVEHEWVLPTIKHVCVFPEPGGRAGA